MPASEDSYRAALAFHRRAQQLRSWLHQQSVVRAGRPGAAVCAAPARCSMPWVRPIAPIQSCILPAAREKDRPAAYAAAIGTAAGYRSGLSTSPHLHSFRERIAIDGIPISPSRLCAACPCRSRRAIGRSKPSNPELGPVTAFELLTAMALLAFADAGCELAVVEVGLGGTFDATNVVTPAVSIITRLDLEHTQMLGDTLASDRREQGRHHQARYSRRYRLGRMLRRCRSSSAAASESRHAPC